MTSVLVDDLQLGSTRLTAGTLLAPDEVQRAIDAGGLVVDDADDSPDFGLVFDALPEVERLKARGDGAAVRVRMLRAYAEALAAQVQDAQIQADAASSQVQALLTSHRLPTLVTLAISASGLGALPAGQKTTAISLTLPARAVLLGFSLGIPLAGFNDNTGTGGATTYTLAATNLFSGENVKRGVGVYPRRPTSPDALAFAGNDQSFASLVVVMTLTSSADLNTVDQVGGISLAIVYAVIP